MSNSEHPVFKIKNLEREVEAIKKQLEALKKENKQLWEYIKSVEGLAEIW